VHRGYIAWATVTLETRGRDLVPVDFDLELVRRLIMLNSPTIRASRSKRWLIDDERTGERGGIGDGSLVDESTPTSGDYEAALS
jgi:hypothetical protein